MRTVALGDSVGEGIIMPEKKSVKKTIAKPVAKAKTKSVVKANKKPTVKVNARPATKSPKKANPVIKKVKKPAIVSKSVPKQKTRASVTAPVKKNTVKAKAKTVKDVIQPIKKPERKVTQTMLTETKPKPKTKTFVANQIPTPTLAPIPTSTPTSSSKPTPTSKRAATDSVLGRTAAPKVRSSKSIIKAHLSTMGVPPYKETKDEEYMNPQQTEHFAKILQLWKKELMEEVDRTVHHMQDDAANFPDPNDRATQEEEFSLELRTRDRERKLIKKIDEALQKIENDEYGYCEVCGIEIGIRRLEARPTATLCIDCKTLDEIRERTHS